MNTIKFNELSKWDRIFYDEALQKASLSKDPSTKVGAIIVRKDNTGVSWGYNGFPRKCNDSVELLNDRNIKLMRTVHAEMNAILNSAMRPLDCTLYVRPLPPCSQCAAAIIQSGISRVVCPILPDPESRWFASCNEGYKMFCEAGVSVLFVEE